MACWGEGEKALLVLEEFEGAEEWGCLDWLGADSGLPPPDFFQG